MKSYDQPRQHIKKQRHYFANKFHLVKALVFPVVMYGYESWTIKKAECWRIDAFELWCWRRLLRVPWTARKSSQSILKEISPEYSLEGWCWSWNSKTLATWCEELKSLLMKEESEKVGLKLNIQKLHHGIWSHHFMANRWRNSGNSSCLFIFGGSKTPQMVIAAMKLKDTYSLEGKFWST